MVVIKDMLYDITFGLIVSFINKKTTYIVYNTSWARVCLYLPPPY